MAKNKLYETIENITDINTLNAMQEEFVSICENHRKHLQVIEEANNIDTNSFFFIKESFGNLSEKLFGSEKGRKLIRKYIKECNTNKGLQKMFFIHENISMADKSLNADAILNEMKTIVGNIEEKAVNEGNKRLLSILREAYIEVGEEAKNMLSTHNNRVLDESVKYVFNNSKKLDNITRYNICLEEIKKYINNNTTTKNIFENRIDVDTILENFNKDFSVETMGEENFNIVKQINEAEDKSSIFEAYKEQCIKAIDEAIEKNLDQNTCNQLIEFKTRILKKNYNPDTLGEDISNFIELKNTVNE